MGLTRAVYAAMALMACSAAYELKSPKAPELGFRMLQRAAWNESTSITPTSTTSSSSSTTSSAPTGTWSIVLNIGQTQVNVGDVDTSTFEDMWKDVCGEQGCAQGTTTDFDSSIVSSDSLDDHATGTFTLEGRVDDNMGWRDWIFDKVNEAVANSTSCGDQDYMSCPCGFKRNEKEKRGDPCCTRRINQCSIVNAVQATVFGPGSSIKAEFDLSTSTDVTNDFDCGAIFDEADAIPIENPFYPGAVTFLKLACGAITGGG